jgi:hypothetical protein
MKTMKQTPPNLTVTTHESNRTLLISGAAYSLLFGAWLMLQLAK